MYPLRTAPKLRPYASSMTVCSWKKTSGIYHKCPPSPYECMPDMIFSAGGIKRQFLKIKIDKASGPDLIPARNSPWRRLRTLRCTLSLFQKFYESVILPHAWKAANIYAIFKKGSKADAKNYRKVSLTSLTPKVVEHIVSCHISRHLSTNRIISQH